MLNRKIQPSLLPVNLGTLPEARVEFLDNRIPVYLIEAGSEDILKLELIFDAGQVAENIPLQASTANLMLTEGSKYHTADELNTKLDFYGAFMNLYCEKDTAGLAILFITRHLESIIELCNEILFLPAFHEHELDALLKKRRQWFNVNREKVHVLASESFFESVFGKDHPYGRKITAGDFSRLTHTMLREFHDRCYSPSGMSVIAAGRIPANLVTVLNSHFGHYPFTEKKPDRATLHPAGKKKKKIFINKEGAVQSAIRIGSRTIGKRHQDYHGIKVVDMILGGYFGSRLMKNIREEKGYTYGISSSVMSFQQSAYKIIGTEVGASNTVKALEEIYKEIYKLQNTPVGRKELETVRNYMLGEMVRMFDGPLSLAESFRSVWEFGLDNSYFYNLESKIKTITPDEIIPLARTYYNIDDLYEVVVGLR